MSFKGLKYVVICALLCVGVEGLEADNRPYLCEIGVQGGIGYYAGDATEHIFHNVRETYGGHFRYKFDPRWSLQVKGLYHRIAGSVPDDVRFHDPEKTLPASWETKMVNVDVVAEFNFFRMGMRSYDRRVKPYSPFIFLGVGCSAYGDGFVGGKGLSWSAYLPVGIGFKWQFARRWTLQAAWQHNIYFADDLETIKELGNTYSLNGGNVMNFDVTSQLTIGIVFAFAKAKKVCRTCEM